MLLGEVLKDDLVSEFKYQGLVGAGTFQEKLCLISSDLASFPSCSAGSPCQTIPVIHWTRVHIGRYYSHTKFVPFCCCCKFLPKESQVSVFTTTVGAHTYWIITIPLSSSLHLHSPPQLFKEKDCVFIIFSLVIYIYRTWHTIFIQ